MWHIALTGSIGCGKSSVAAWLARKGARVFDADAAAHRVIRTPEALCRGKALWGDECLTADKAALDTGCIARIIFNDVQARRAWESFIHAGIERYLKQWLEQVETEQQQAEEEQEAEQEQAEHDQAEAEQASAGMMIVYDIPLFFETDWGRGRTIDEIWVVYATREKCVERLAQNRGMTMEDIHARLAAQMPIEEKTSRADVVIENSGPWEDTVKQLEDLVRTKTVRTKTE